MQYTEIKGQNVSRFGLGIGSSNIATREYLVDNPKMTYRLIGRAYDLGVTIFDTAPIYKTEEMLAYGLGADRKQVLISTKSPHHLSIRAGWKTVPDRMNRALEESLRHFGHIDFYFFHALTSGVYSRAYAEGIIGEGVRFREQGKIRFLGISEDAGDAQHLLLRQSVLGSSVTTGVFDAVMGVPSFGFPFQNAAKKNIATFAMRAAATALPYTGNSHPLRYKAALQKADVVLMGTSSISHLEDNIAMLDDEVEGGDSGS